MRRTYTKHKKHYGESGFRKHENRHIHKTQTHEETKQKPAIVGFQVNYHSQVAEAGYNKYIIIHLKINIQ
jgi:hypothetical protein